MEFIVAGAPRSANANPRSRRRWRERVARAARESLQAQGGPTDHNHSVLIIYFYQGETTLDVDNIAKSLLDGLKGILFPGRPAGIGASGPQEPLRCRVIADRSEPISAGGNRAHGARGLRFRLCSRRSGARP